MSPIRTRVLSPLLGCLVPAAAFLSAAPAGAKTTTLEKAPRYLAKKIAPRKAKAGDRVAILPFFTLDGETSQFGKYLSEQLLNEIYGLGKLDIVDRALIDKVMGELKLGMSGMLDQESVQEAGKLLGASLVGTGTYADLGKKISVNARLIRTETGTVEGAAGVKIKVDDEVAALLASRPSSPGTGRARKLEKGPLLFEQACEKPWKKEFSNSSFGCRSGRMFFDYTKHTSQERNFVNQGGTYRDLIVEVEARRLSGPKDAFYGVGFRYDWRRHTYYAGITDTGRYELARMGGPNEKPGPKALLAKTVLREGSDKRLAGRDGKARLLKIVCSDRLIQLHVDGKLIAEAEDSSIEDGGMLVLSVDPAVNADFRGLRVYAVK